MKERTIKAAKKLFIMLVLNVAISASDNEGTVKAGGMPGRKIKFRYGMFFTGEYGMGDDNKED